MQVAKCVKVLIADDHPKMRDCIQNMIRTLGVETFEASDGWSAVMAYRRHVPDWVLLDIDMPGLDGVLATQEILRLAPLARIVLVTAFDSPALRKAAAAAGALALVPKSELQRLKEILQPSNPILE